MVETITKAAIAGSGESTYGEGWIYDFGSTVFVIAGGKLFRSDDGAQSWSDITPPDGAVMGKPVSFGRAHVEEVSAGQYNIWTELFASGSGSVNQGYRIQLRLNGTVTQERFHTHGLRLVSSRALGAMGYGADRFFIEGTHSSSIGFRHTAYRVDGDGAYPGTSLGKYRFWSASFLPSAQKWNVRSAYTTTRSVRLYRDNTLAYNAGSVAGGSSWAFTEDALGGCYLALREDVRTISLYYRNPSNTTTTTKTTLTLPSGRGCYRNMRMSFVTVPNKVVLVTSEGRSLSTSRLKYRVYDPTANTWSADWVELDSSLLGVDSVSPLAPSTVRIVADDTPNQQLLTIRFNHDPSQPQWVTASGARNNAERVPLAWTFVDPDPDDAQGAYQILRSYTSSAGSRVSDYWNATSGAWQSGQRKNNGSDPSASVTILSDVSIVQSFQVRCWDNYDNGPSPWSDVIAITPAVPDNPTITAPAADGDDVGATSAIQWTVASQMSYQIRMLGGTSSQADTSTVYYNSGVVDNTNVRSHTIPFEADGATRWIELTTWNADGLISDVQYRRATVNILPPAAALVLIAVHDAYGEVTVHPIQPAPVGSEPGAARIEIWRRVDGQSGDGIPISSIGSEGYFIDRTLATGMLYEYRTRTVGTDDGVAWSDWTDGDADSTNSVPSAPTNLALSRSGIEVLVSWAAPALLGGLPVPVYRIEWSFDEVLWFNTISDRPSLNLTGRYGQTLYVRVAAVNAAGQGFWETGSIVIPRATAAPPTGIGAAITTTTFDSGLISETVTRILGEVVQLPDGGVANVVSLEAFRVNGRILRTLTFLASLRVRIGTTTPSKTVEWRYKDGTKPNLGSDGTVIETDTTSPQAVDVTHTAVPANRWYWGRYGSGSGSLLRGAEWQVSGISGAVFTVRWTAPTVIGDSAISGYVIRWSADPAGGVWEEQAVDTATATSATIDVTDITATYYVQIKTVNDAGGGRWSNIVSSA